MVYRSGIFDSLILRVLFFSRAGKLVEEQQLPKKSTDHSGENSDGDSANGEAGEPPTPPHTPQREPLIRMDKGLMDGASFPRHAPFQHLDPLQQQALHARVSNVTNFFTVQLANFIPELYFDLPISFITILYHLLQSSLGIFIYILTYSFYYH